MDYLHAAFCFILYSLFFIIYSLRNRTMKDNILIDKTLKFAAKIVKLHKYPPKKNTRQFIIKRLS